MLQWDPPEFLRTPSAISYMWLGRCATFVGKVGKDEFGDELVLMMNKEKVPDRNPLRIALSCCASSCTMFYTGCYGDK